MLHFIWFCGNQNVLHKSDCKIFETLISQKLIGLCFFFFHVIFVEYDQACPTMSNFFGNNKAPISPKYWLILFTFWICIEAKVLCSYSWLWSSMLKVLRNNKLPISLKRVEWFVDFLDVVIYFSLYILSSYKSMLFSGGIIWHGL